MDLSHPFPAGLAAGSRWVWRARHSGEDLLRARSSEYRDPYARDRARLLHAAAARRLMGKSQVPGLLQTMLPRSWQTHVLEVSQLSRGMLRALQHLHAHGEPWLDSLPDVNLLEAIALGRSLGHAPFGAAGDETLAVLMQPHGGFHPGWQALRLVQWLEPHTEGHGLDLTRRTLMGLLHRAMLALPTPGRDAACLAWQEWLLQPLSDRDRQVLLGPVRPAAASQALTLDASLVRLAEAVAQAVHGLDDALAAGAVRREDWARVQPEPVWAEAVDLDPARLAEALFGGAGPARRGAIGTLVNAMLISVEVEADATLDEPLLHHRAQWIAPADAFLAQLQAVVTQAWTRWPPAQAAASDGRQALQRLWHRAWTDPALLGLPAHDSVPPDAWARLLCDRLSGLTDTAALHLAGVG